MWFNLEQNRRITSQRNVWFGIKNKIKKTEQIIVPVCPGQFLSGFVDFNSLNAKTHSLLFLPPIVSQYDHVIF